MLIRFSRHSVSQFIYSYAIQEKNCLKRLVASPIHQHSRDLHIVSTLRPDLLKQDDFVDMSAKKAKHLSFASDIRKGIHLCYYSANFRRVRFPPATWGFLYHYTLDTLPKFMSHLRFRVTPTNDPSTFKRGHDLLLPSGLPWQYPLFSKRNKIITNHLISQLRLEELIEEETIIQLERLRQHFASLGKVPPPISQIIHRTGQDFFYDIGSDKDLWVVNFSAQGELQIGQIHLRLLQRVSPNRRLSFEKCYPTPGEFFSIPNKPYVIPVPGKVMAHFEPGSLEDLDFHVIRVTKIIEPAQWSSEVFAKRGPIHVLPPKEGELLKRLVSRNTATVKPRIFNAKLKTYAALRFLTRPQIADDL